MPDQTDANPSIDLGMDIQFLPKVGPKRAKLFKRLGIDNAAALIKHLPARYEYHAGDMPIKDLALDMIATAKGMVTNCRFIPARSSPIGRPRGGAGRFTATIADDTGRLDLVWFNGSFLKGKIHPGTWLAVTGKVTKHEYRQMVNPNYVILEEGKNADTANERLRAIYPATEDLSSKVIEEIIENSLPTLLPQINDHLDDSYRDARKLPPLAQAYKLIHQPREEDEVKVAARRLAYDELLMLQLGLAITRARTKSLDAPALRWNEAIDKAIRNRFPFELTESQNKVVADIAADLQRPVPMNRLVQGDVGSGKTVVALYALLMSVAAGKQGALMAPTELLAEQHYLSISKMLDGSSVNVSLITGSLPTATQRALREQVSEGQVDIVIGTQSLISKSLQFADLGVVVIDEQHRFGVEQRALLREKRANDSKAGTLFSGDDADTGDTTDSSTSPASPHFLVMTATPIPRTLSLTVFGDLDVSTIDGLPPGRQPIITRVVGPGKSPDVYKYIAERVAKGEQLYVVVPAVDDGNSELKSVTTHAKHLKETYFPDHEVGMVHGQLKRSEREAIMERFRSAELQVLVATTVIEVGVDVPNATMIVVEHADRFGLAQLHQLRGRVGRGSKRSLCVFIAEPSTDEGAERMQAIESTTDGFVIAEADLRIRGMGEFFGTRQHGAPPLSVAKLPDHMDLLRLAGKDAAQIVKQDMTLSDPKHSLLRARLIKAYGPEIGLADVG